VYGLASLRYQFLHLVLNAQLLLLQFRFQEDIFGAQVGAFGDLLELRFEAGMLFSEVSEFGVACQQLFANFPKHGHRSAS
jgi:hypothetical protein